jgi:hypothetical protein
MIKFLTLDRWLESLRILFANKAESSLSCNNTENLADGRMGRGRTIHDIYPLRDRFTYCF